MTRGPLGVGIWDGGSVGLSVRGVEHTVSVTGYQIASQAWVSLIWALPAIKAFRIGLPGRRHDDAALVGRVTQSADIREITWGCAGPATDPAAAIGCEGVVNIHLWVHHHPALDGSASAFRQCTPLLYVKSTPQVASGLELSKTYPRHREQLNTLGRSSGVAGLCAGPREAVVHPAFAAADVGARRDEQLRTQPMIINLQRPQHCTESALSLTKRNIVSAPSVVVRLRGNRMSRIRIRSMATKHSRKRGSWRCARLRCGWLARPQRPM